jgi:hypothetical protein
MFAGLFDEYRLCPYGETSEKAAAHPFSTKIMIVIHRHVFNMLIDSSL